MHSSTQQHSSSNTATQQQHTAATQQQHTAAQQYSSTTAEQCSSHGASPWPLHRDRQARGLYWECEQHIKNALISMQQARGLYCMPFGYYDPFKVQKQKNAASNWQL